MRVFGLVMSIIALGCVGVSVVKQFALTELERKRQPSYATAVILLLAPIMAWVAVFFFLEFLHDIRSGRW